MRTKSGMWTRAALAVGLAALGAVGWMATNAHAQTPTAIEWTTFVAGEGISRRRLANDDRAASTSVNPPGSAATDGRGGRR